MRTGESLDRYTLLLLFLGALLLLGPLLDGLTDPIEFGTILFLGLMLTLARALQLHRAVMVVGSVLLLSGFVYETALNSGLLVIEQSWILAITPFAYFVFVGAATSGLLGVLLSHDTVTLETVRGGIAVYLLLAVLWSLLFEVVAMATPAAFSGIALADAADPAILRGKFLYFSLTTITTLGYGDIVPNSMFARNLATLEAVSGQVFLAVFMARLVAMRVAQELKQR